MSNDKKLTWKRKNGEDVFIYMMTLREIKEGMANLEESFKRLESILNSMQGAKDE